MAITITNLRAEFVTNTHKKVEIEFAGDGGETHGGKGRHNAESDAVKGNGNEFSFPTEDIDLHLTDSGILTVTAKVSKMLLPDKVIGEGKAQVGGGQQRVQLVDRKTGESAGMVYFDVTAKRRDGIAGAVAGATGHHGGHGVGQQGSAYGNTGTSGGMGFGEQTGTLRDAGPVREGTGGISSGQQGYDRQPGSSGGMTSGGGIGGQQGYGQPGRGTSSSGIGGSGVGITGQQSYGQSGGNTTSGGGFGDQQGYGQQGSGTGTGSGIGGQQGYGQPGSTTSSGGLGGGQPGSTGIGGSQQGSGYGGQGQGQETGMVQGGQGYEQEGNRPQEFHEKRAHNVHDHDENESFSRDVY